jgi:hypothetical protein
MSAAKSARDVSSDRGRFGAASVGTMAFLKDRPLAPGLKSKPSIEMK